MEIFLPKIMWNQRIEGIPFQKVAVLNNEFHNSKVNVELFTFVEQPFQKTKKILFSQVVEPTSVLS